MTKEGGSLMRNEHVGAVIRVVGVGGGGSNAVNSMIEAGIAGVDFIAMNTDVQALDRSKAPTRLQLGPNVTRGLGAGGNPEVGRQAAEESKAEVRRLLEGSDMVFITAGMGGGTGTGSASVVADLAREIGAVTVAIVTKPFMFEGRHRIKMADQGITSLIGRVDTMITIPNSRLMDVAEKRTPLRDAFKLADEVLRQGVQGISDIITVPGMINVDFADVKAVMANAGPALMGIGYGVGEHRAIQAAQAATSSPLLEQTINGARGLLVNITSGEDLTLAEVSEAMDYIHSLCDDEEAAVYFGAVIDPDLTGEVRITVLATGFDPNAPIPVREKAKPRQEEIWQAPVITEEVEEVEAASDAEEIKATARPPFRGPLDTGRTRPSDIWRNKTPKEEPVEEQGELDEDEMNIPAFLRNVKRKKQLGQD
jgi:cell division protein FtsZ